MTHHLSTPILHCLKQRAAALGHPDSWDWVLRDPLVGCFAPALFQLEKAGAITLTAEVREQSRQVYWHITADWVRREHELRAILDQLDGAGIEVIPLKGAVLINTLYKKAGLRPFSDIDLLVKPGQFLPAAELLLDLGLQPSWYIQDGDVFAFTRLPRAHWPRELSFRGAGQVCVDLHGALITTKWFDIAYPIQNEAVWARSQTLDHSQAEAAREQGLFWRRTLSPYDTLAHLCFHLGAHGLAIIKNLFDIDQFVRQLPDDWRWERYLEIAWEWQVRSCSYHVFSYCVDLFNTPIPGDVLASLDPGWLNRWVVSRLLTSSTLIAGQPVLGRKYPSLVKFSLIDTLMLKIRTFFKLVFSKSHWHEDRAPSSALFGHWRHIIQVILRGD